MIVHSLIQQMSNDGFGTVNEYLQMGVLPLDGNGNPRNGIAIAPRGAPINRIRIEVQAIDYYVRNTNPLTASAEAQRIIEYLKASYSDVCDLPPLEGYTTDSYRNVTIVPTSSVEFVGVDDNGGHSFVVSGEVRYIKVTDEES